MNKKIKPSPRLPLKLTDEHYMILKEHAEERGMKASIARHCSISKNTVKSILETGKAEYHVITKVRNYIVNIIPQYATL